MGLRLVLESIFLFLLPTTGGFSLLELSCVAVGSFFCVLYLVVLGLWIVASQSSPS